MTNCIEWNVKIEGNINRNGKTEKNGVNLYAIKKLEGIQGRPIHWKGKEVGGRKYLILKCIEINLKKEEQPDPLGQRIDSV